MSKKQNPTPLKVRKALTSNHNETALKVRMIRCTGSCCNTNHNETALKVK